MKYIDKISYRYYEKENPILVVYNYVNGATYYYESISAELLNAVLNCDEKEQKRIIIENGLTEEEVSEFVNETNLLFNVSQDSESISTFMDDNIIDNGEIVSQICNEMYNQNILYRFHLDITGKCNFRCIHCYHPFESYTKDILTVNDFEELFKDLYELGVFIITISGGEPFLRTDLLEILKIGEKYNFVFQILTNGYFIDDDLMKKISECNVSKLSFSYYGSSECHAMITGNKNSHSRLMKTVDLCIKYNIPYELKFVLLNENIEEFDGYINLCKTLGIRVLFEPCLIPKLDGDNGNFAHRLNFEKYKEFMRSHIQYFYDDIDITQYSDKCINCSAGKYGLYCDHTGNIFPCVSYREHLGNWKNIIGIWNASEKIRDIRNRNYQQFLSFNKYSFCRYCYQICPGLSLCENGNSLECKNSGCLVAQVIESVRNEIN